MHPEKGTNDVRAMILSLFRNGVRYGGLRWAVVLGLRVIDGESGTECLYRGDSG